MRQCPDGDIALTKSLADILPNLLFFCIGVGIVVLVARWSQLLENAVFAAYTAFLHVHLLRSTGAA
jgi:hypothetical protein